MSDTLPVGAETGASPEESVGRVLALLQEVLDIVDGLSAPPEIGARVQELIDLVEQHQRSV